MHEKMTDEEAVLYQQIASGDVAVNEELLREWTVKAAAHLAALTAERDSYRERGPSALSAGWLEPVEAAALRERVTALEAEVGAQEAWMADARTREAQLEGALLGARSARQDTESRLAAIRQRAGDPALLVLKYQRGGMVAVSNYIVGDDAPAPSEMSGLEGEMAEKPTMGLNPADFLPRPVERRPMPPPAPTAAEAFATVRNGLHVASGASKYPTSKGTVEAAEHALSLLERRMGAQEAALREVLKLHHRLPGDVIEQLQTALTDTQPVFTLEEVLRVASTYVPPKYRADLRHDLESLRR